MAPATAEQRELVRDKVRPLSHPEDLDPLLERIGDARFTDMADDGMGNIGQLAHERFEDEGVVLVGFGSHRGSVAGALGHGIAWLLGVDPKHQLDEDLVRMKTFLETGIPPHDASRPAPQADETVPGPGIGS